jgi:NAD(P)-dependent dehydrogenase (short-subunit alcohol dehydrogenase family)
MSMPFVGGAAYAMSKSALQGLVKGLARDLGPRGITINNVQPGPVDTALNPAIVRLTRSPGWSRTLPAPKPISSPVLA